MLGVRQCELAPDTIICTTDKDLDMIPGWHYTWEIKRLGQTVRKAQKYYVNAYEASHFFYYQLLVGDSTDNIKGVVGIGKQKAEKLLSGLWSEEEMFNCVREQYSNDEEMEMNAQVLWIWRKPGDIWKFDPTKRES